MMEIQNKLLSATNRQLEVADAEARSVIPQQANEVLIVARHFVLKQHTKLKRTKET